MRDPSDLRKPDKIPKLTTAGREPSPNRLCQQGPPLPVSKGANPFPGHEGAIVRDDEERPISVPIADPKLAVNPAPAVGQNPERTAERGAEALGLGQPRPNHPHQGNPRAPQGIGSPGQRRPIDPNGRIRTSPEGHYDDPAKFPSQTELPGLTTRAWRTAFGRGEKWEGYLGDGAAGPQASQELGADRLLSHSGGWAGDQHGGHQEGPSHRVRALATAATRSCSAPDPV